jgi:hypothetical protein
MSVIYFTYKLEQCTEKSHTLKYRLFAHRLCLRKYFRALGNVHGENTLKEITIMSLWMKFPRMNIVWW